MSVANEKWPGQGPEMAVSGQVSSANNSPSSSTNSAPMAELLAHAAATNSASDDESPDPKNKPKRPSKGRMFQCTGYPDCNMLFTRLEHLARHKRKHTGERPFTCPHCAKNFSRLDNLRQHKQTVHAYESFVGKDHVTAPYLLLQENPASNPNPNPATPNQPLFAFLLLVPPLGASLILPPNLNLPHYPHIHGYQQNHHNQQNTQSQQQQQPQQHQNLQNLQNQHPYQQQHYLYPVPQNQHHHQLAPFGLSLTGSALKLPALFKPKRRPRPLSLLHLYSDELGLQLPGARNVLKLAPPNPLSVPIINLKNVLLYAPKLALLTPNMVSPLLPLFHQLFNQVLSSLLSLFTVPLSDNTATLPFAQKFPNSASQQTQLPLVQHLPIPANFKPLETASPALLPPVVMKKDHWLKGMLNADSDGVGNALADRKDHCEAKKSTIHSLLSPYENDRFQVR